MTITDQIKVSNRKIVQNEAQHNLDRKAAKISALSSNNLDKHEYLTGEDVGLKQVVLNKLNLSILQLVEFLVKAWIKIIKNKDCLRD